MTNDRLSGLALIGGSAGVIITLSLHPSGRELFAPGQFEAAARNLIAVHSLALVSLPVWFLGACGLSRRLSLGAASETGARGMSDDRCSFAALVFYGFAMAAMMTAVVLDGLVTPGIARQIVDTTGTVGQGWRIAFNLNGLMNEAFVHVFLVASSLAIVLWSASIARSGVLVRWAGAMGCVLGLITVIAVFSGQLDRYHHLFGMVIVGQALWFILVGALLWRTEKNN